MNHDKWVKELAQKYGEAVVKAATGPSPGSLSRADPVLKRSMALRAAIDAMQSALDDAVAERDKYMGLWAALSQDEGKAERAIAELEATLAARDAEVERLRKDADLYQRLRNKPTWSVDIDHRESPKVATWSVEFHCLYGVEDFEDSLNDAIDAAWPKEVKGTTP